MDSISQFFRNHLKIVLGLIIVIIVVILVRQRLLQSKTQPTYQTATAQTGSLVTTVSASGTVSAGNSVGITTQATGVVTNVYVKNGDTVSQGQRIADMTLDQSSQQKLAAANATYQNAINSEKQAEEAKTAADATLWKDRQTVLDDQNTEDLKNQGVNNPSTKLPYTNLEMQVIDSALIQANKQFDTDQQKVYDADQVITAAKATQIADALALTQISPVITAPMSGVVTNLTLVPGLAVSNNTNSNTSAATSTSTTSQSFGTITLPETELQATVNLSEIDAVNVKPGQKVTMTLDAFPNQTFTGRLLSINTNGSVSSGVTTYPATIVFDSSVPNIYPNMAVSAKIITNIENNVLLVPSAAIQTVNGQSTVRILRNGKPQSQIVQIGDSNDTQTVITAGLQDGDQVITGGGPTQQSTTTGGTSPFSAFGGRGFGGGGGGTFRGGAAVGR